jgi:hypothetical protein
MFISPQDCLGIFEVSLRLPGILCCGVSLPGHQVLPLASCSTVGQDPVQFELLLSANEVTRGVGVVRAMFRRLPIGR